MWFLSAARGFVRQPGRNGSGCGMWGTQFREDHGSAGLMVGLHDPEGPSSLNDSVKRSLFLLYPLLSCLFL